MRRAVAVLACVSCTLPSLDLASKGCPCASGYTCDEATGRCVVGGASAGDASPPMDATLSDAPATDGASDAGSDVRADATLPDAGCPGHPAAIFCDSFDDGALGARWSSTEITNAGLTLSQAQSSSAPTSIFAAITAPDGGTTGESTAALILDIPRAFPKVRSTFDIYIEKRGQRSAVIGSVYVKNGLRPYSIALLAHGGTATMDDVQEDGDLPDGGKYGAHHPFRAIPPNTWARVIIDIDFGASPTVTLTLEAPPFFAPATPVVDHQAISPTVTPVTTTVYAGIDYVLPPETMGWRVYFDNVVIEAP